jgi:hypothetical protein
LELLAYLTFVFGVVGIGLGLYGLLKPALRSAGPDALLSALRSWLSRAAPPAGNHGFNDDDGDGLEEASFHTAAFDDRAVRLARALAPAPATAPPSPASSVPATAAVEPESAYDEADSEVLAILDEAVEDEEGQTGEIEAELESDGTLPAEDPAATPDAADDILALFEEAVATSTVPSALREAIQEVDIHDLLSEARELHHLLDPQGAGRGAA